MAARNPTNSKAAAVNALIPGNEEEKKILEGGECMHLNIIFLFYIYLLLFYNHIACFI